MSQYKSNKKLTFLLITDQGFCYFRLFQNREHVLSQFFGSRCRFPENGRNFFGAMSQKNSKIRTLQKEGFVTSRNFYATKP